MVLHRVARAPALLRRLEGWAASAGFTHRLGSPVLFLAERIPGLGKAPLDEGLR